MAFDLPPVRIRLHKSGDLRQFSILKNGKRGQIGSSRINKIPYALADMAVCSAPKDCLTA
jgi:hypothetical protein